MVSVYVDEGVLGQVGTPLTVIVLVDQVRFGPEGAQSELFKRFPPLEEIREFLIPHMDLQLKLPEWQRLATRLVFADDSVKRIEFPPFDVNLQDIDESVIVDGHETLKSVELGFVFFFVSVPSGKSVGIEVRAIRLCARNFRAERFYREVIAPDLATMGSGEKSGFKRGFVIDAKRIDDAIFLGCQTRDATDPFSSVSKCA